MIEVNVTWGDGPDILLDIKTKIVLMEDANEFQNWTHGTCGHSHLDLTAEEALSLAAALEQAAYRVKQLEDAAEALNERAEGD